MTYKIIFLFSFILLLASCGADKLSPKAVSSGQSSLNANGQSCSCTSSYSPVCGNDGKNYDNSCLAQCFGTAIKNTGHCDCSQSSTMVCGADGKDYTECDAKSANIQIVKFIPCAATEI